MAEETPPPSPSPSPQIHPLPPQPHYLEVNCKSSGKTRRFAAGTDAGFAVAVINRKLKGGIPMASHIEAVKEDGEDEEPIAFGPNSVLADFGDGWKLQTVTHSDLVSSFVSGGVRNGDVPRMAPVLVSGVPGPEMRVSKPISSLYIVKILFAFILIFVLGAIFTLILDNLPALILYVQSLI